MLCRRPICHEVLDSGAPADGVSRERTEDTVLADGDHSSRTNNQPQVSPDAFLLPFHFLFQNNFTIIQPYLRLLTALLRVSSQGFTISIRGYSSVMTVPSHSQARSSIDWFSKRTDDENRCSTVMQVHG